MAIIYSKSSTEGSDPFEARLRMKRMAIIYSKSSTEGSDPFEAVAELVRIPWGHHRFIIDKCSVMSSTKSRCLSEFRITN